MSPRQFEGDLPEPVRRYFNEVADLEPPAGLLDAAIADIERAPRVRRFAALPVVGFTAAAAAVIGIIVYGLLLTGPANVVSPHPTSPRESAEPSAALDADGLVGRFSDRNDDPRVGLYPPDPDLLTAAVRFADGDLVFSMRYAEDFPTEGSVSIVIADPDTVPPDGPASGSSAPYCSPYEGPIQVWYRADEATADLAWHDWPSDTVRAPVAIDAAVNGREVTITIPAEWVVEIRALDPTDPRLSFSIQSSLDREQTSWDNFPDRDLECSTVDLPSAPTDALRVFDSEEISSLFPQDGDFEGASRSFFAEAYPGEASPDGLLRRSGFGLTRDESSTRYPFIFGGWVSVWTDAAAARAGLALESPWSTEVIEPIELPAGGLGEGGRCAVVDWGSLADRGWCEFSVSNATFEFYIRTNTNGTDLDPDAAADIALLASRMRERAEDLATRAR